MEISERRLFSIHSAALISFLATLFISGCASSIPPSAFARTTPTFDPITFWSGHTSSWGVIENLDGAPTSVITTTTDGVPEGASGLKMIQHVFRDGDDTVRQWHIRRLGDHQFEATANDVIGTARGETSGRTLHWTWTLATKPGNPLYNVTMNQWMYLADNGTLLNRTVVTKLGVRLAEISEQFIRSERTPASNMSPN